MNKQKICIIGGSLTGLTTAISLSQLNYKIDLITSFQNNSKSTRTIAISQNNLNFLKELNISKLLNKKMWPCNTMKIYTETKEKKISETFNLVNNNNTGEILYMIKNDDFIKLLNSKIKKIKSISIKKCKKISEIKTSDMLKSIKLNNKEYKYNLIIICTGSNSNIVKNLFNEKIIKNSYNEKSIITILNHNSLKNNTARQLFFDNGILALLPISNTKTSVVWSVKKQFDKKNKFLIKKKIQSHTKDYLKNIKFFEKIEDRELNFLIRKNYYKERVLLFGDALHVIHPFVGQGFNMVLRDLACLEKILKNKKNLGLDIGSIDTLSEFSQQTKQANFAFSIGVDLLKNSFSINNKYFKSFRNSFIKTLNKSSFAKNILLDIADKGLRF
jgi:2-octaprenyl-6-methoxyphenol hydroxylase